MGGGLMELVAYGAQDVYLTGNPQITFFKVVYRRHTNFSIEAIQQSASGNAVIGDSENEASFTIARNGDLIHKVYLTTNTHTNHGIEHGSQIIKEVEISIGGQMIDRYTQEWQDIWNELTIPKCKAMGFKAMTGNVGKSNYNGDDGVSEGVKMVQIPLLFWFCRNPGLALPLIALQYHEVKIDFKFNKNTEILHNEKNINDNYEEFKVDLYIDYIYLDTDERRRFAQVSHEYLIEQIQYLKTNDSTVIDININHPVKELIWTSGGAHHGSYQNAKLVLNGHDRFEKQPEEYFQLRQPYDYHTSIPRPNLPNSATHNISLFSLSTIDNFPTNGLEHINTTSGSFASQINESPSTTDGSNNVTDLNNDFDFNGEINDSNKFLYYPTFSLRADNNSHSSVFDPYPTSNTGDRETTNNTYRFPGFFTNSHLYDPGLRHIFLPKDLTFLKANVDFSKYNFSTNDSSNFGIRYNNLFLSGNLTYMYGNGTGSSGITNAFPKSQININPKRYSTDSVLISTYKIFKLADLFSVNLVDDTDNDKYMLIPGVVTGDNPRLTSELYENELHEFMVLVLPGNIKIIEGNDYDFEVQQTDSDETNHIHASVIKVIKGSDVADVSVNTDNDRNAAFGGADYTAADEANTIETIPGTPDNVNQREDIFGSRPLDETHPLFTNTFANKNDDYAFKKARGITPVGGDNVANVQFIYLDHVINPDLIEIPHGDYRNKSLPVLNDFLIDDNRAQPFTNLSKFKIISIKSMIEKHTQKSASNTSNFRKKINVYSFSLKPEEHQPSGTCNFSRIDTAQLITDNKIGTNHNIYAVNYNVLRIMSGMGGLAYSN